jgi:hypothetical protein
VLYNEDSLEDVVNILSYINEFTKEIGLRKVQIESQKVFEVCVHMRQEFPHIDGLEKASVFKKAANFVAWFIACEPIKTNFPPNSIRGLKGDFNPNAVIAFDIALNCLNDSGIASKTGDLKVSNKIVVSDHSYADIIYALSQGITPESHYHLLAVFFEQLTYKTNPHCEYSPSNGHKNLYYPAHSVDGDDLTGV